MPGAAVLGRVREQLCGAEVRNDLNRRGRALGQVDDQLDRHVAARGQDGEGRAESLCQGRRMDAVGQVAELGNRFHRSPVGCIDQPGDPLEVAVPGVRDHAPEMLAGEPQLHHDGDHLSLRPVVQILLNATQPRGRVVHDKSP